MTSFTPSAQQALALARREAARLDHSVVDTEHLLLGLIALDQGKVLNVLKKMGIEPSAIRQEVEKQVGPGSKSDGPPPPKIPYSPRFKRVLALAGKEAKALNHWYVGTEHLLLGLMRESDGVGARVLAALGMDMERTRAEIIKELNPSEPEKKSFFIPAGEVDLIRQELAVLKSKVENISLTVDEADQRPRPPSSSQVAPSLRELSEPKPPITRSDMVRVLNYTLWFLAFVWLVKTIANRFRKA